MVDHHTLMQGFWDWQAEEQKTRGYMPGAGLGFSLSLHPCLNPRCGHVGAHLLSLLSSALGPCSWVLDLRTPCVRPCTSLICYVQHLGLPAAGNWKWIIPPLAASTSPCYLGLNKMIEYTLKPALLYAPGFKQ